MILHLVGYKVVEDITLYSSTGKVKLCDSPNTIVYAMYIVCILITNSSSLAPKREHVTYVIIITPHSKVVIIITYVIIITPHSKVIIIITPHYNVVIIITPHNKV